MLNNPLIIGKKPAEAGVDWLPAVLPSSASWYSITYGNGMFVSVAQGGNIAAYSTDGINWTETTLPSSDSWISVTFGNGKFVALALIGNKAAYSTDGINWTPTTLSEEAIWTSVTYGDGKFVAVANYTIAAYSTDGISWTEITLPSSANWQSVTYGDGKFVAVANDSNKAAYSTDGINWAETALPSSASWFSVTYGNGKFVAVEYSTNKAAYSTNAINWTETTFPSSASWFSVTYGNGKFVAVAHSSNKAAYSTDGISWTETTLPSSANWQSVTYGDGKFVAVANSGNKAAYSMGGDSPSLPTLTNPGTATDLLPGKQLIDQNGNVLIGSMPVQGPQIIIPGTANKTIAAGRYLSGTQTVLGDPDLIPANIKKGVEIFGVSGTNEGAPSVPQALYRSEMTITTKSKEQITATYTLSSSGPSISQIFGVVFRVFNVAPFSSYIDYFKSNSDEVCITSAILYVLNGVPVFAVYDRISRTSNPELSEIEWSGYTISYQNTAGNPFKDIFTISGNKITVTMKPALFSQSGYFLMGNINGQAIGWEAHLIAPSY